LYIISYIHFIWEPNNPENTRHTKLITSQDSEKEKRKMEKERERERRKTKECFTNFKVFSTDTNLMGRKKLAYLTLRI
jgi:hypothetical protein